MMMMMIMMIMMVMMLLMLVMQAMQPNVNVSGCTSRVRYQTPQPGRQLHSRQYETPASITAWTPSH